MIKWMESQIEARERLDREAIERAYAELAASVSEERHAPLMLVDDDEQIDAATRACLQYCGTMADAAPASVKGVDERIEWMCRPSGTMHRAVRLDKGWQANAFGAMVGHLDTGEVVALLPRGVRGYCYVEPGTGRRVKVTPRVAEHVAEDAVLFYRPLPARALGLRDLIAFILRVLDVNDYLLVLVAALAVTLIGLLPARANQIAFGLVVPSGQAALIAPVAVLLFGVALSTALIGTCRGLIMSRVSIKLDTAIGAATFARVLSLPTSFFKQYSSGNLSSRVNNMTMLAQQLVSLVLGGGLSALLSFVYVVQIGSFAPVLVVPALTVVLLQTVLTTSVTFVIRRYGQRAMAEQAAVSGTVTALLDGIQKIKLAGAEDRAFARWARSYAAYAKPAYNRPTVTRALPALVAVVGLLGGIAIYYFAGTTGVSMADYMAFNTAYGQVSGAVTSLAAMAAQVAMIRPMLDMVQPILEASPEVAQDRPSVESVTGGIEVSDVTFRYDEHSPYVLKDLSFRVRPGEYVALVGRSGCGKSTIMRLLLGFERPERGTVFYGPNDVSKVDLRSLRRHIGVVTQDGRLFMGDLMGNITISAPTATIDDAWEAAEVAGIAADIRKMPMGMQTIVAEGGGGISGGQRQRILIARAVCGHRRILLFDEATSALDNVTQKHVADSLAKLKCTRLVVAHRLSTVRHCDRILVVDGGHIAEEGTYEELIARGGLFAELVERQRLDTDV